MTMHVKDMSIPGNIINNYRNDRPNSRLFPSLLSVI